MRTKNTKIEKIQKGLKTFSGFFYALPPDFPAVENNGQNRRPLAGWRALFLGGDGYV